MATSGDDIKGYILDELGAHPDKFNIEHANLKLFIECIAKGSYKGMQKLDDNQGLPASTGHK